MKAVHAHVHPAVGVERARILTARADHDVRPVPLEHRLDDAPERLGVRAVAAARPQLDVDVVPCSVRRPRLRRGARLGMRRTPAAVSHVQRDRQHVVAVVEAGLRAVPVVHVPIDDRHSLCARCPKPLGGERDVVEEAIPVGDAPGRRDGPEVGRARRRWSTSPATSASAAAKVVPAAARSGSHEAAERTVVALRRRHRPRTPHGCSRCTPDRGQIPARHARRAARRCQRSRGAIGPCAGAPTACSECARRSQDGAPALRADPTVVPPRGRYPFRARGRPDARTQRAPPPRTSILTRQAPAPARRLGAGRRVTRPSRRSGCGRHRRRSSPRRGSGAWSRSCPRTAASRLRR